MSAQPSLPLAPRAPPICLDGHCVTCADEGVRMRVIELRPGALALCEDGDGTRTEVMTDLVGAASIGDTLLVHAATALARLARPEPGSGR